MSEQKYVSSRFQDYTYDIFILWEMSKKNPTRTKKRGKGGRERDSEIPEVTYSSRNNEDAHLNIPPSSHFILPLHGFFFPFFSSFFLFSSASFIHFVVCFRYPRNAAANARLFMRDSDTHVHGIVSTEPVKLEIVNFFWTSWNYGFPLLIFPLITFTQCLSKSELEIILIYHSIYIIDIDNNIWTDIWKFPSNTNSFFTDETVCRCKQYPDLSKDSRAICANSKSHGRLKKQKGMFADLWAGPKRSNHPFNKGQGGSSRNEGLIVCVFSRCLLFFAPDIALFQHAWAPWRACNVAINRDYRCPIRLFYSISPRPYADRSRVIWTVKAGKGTAALAMEWKKGKRKRERGKGNGKKKKSGTYSRKVTFFEAATCFHRVSGSPARKMLGLATWLLKWRKYLTLAECILFMYLVQRCMHGHCFVCLSAND